MLLIREAPNKFTDKERDEKTGYDYFGARYYDSDLSQWLSVDPMSDKYPNLSPYNYCAWNPVILVDPDGNSTNPVYDYDGNFLGTDDKGLQGEAIFMNKSDFKQGMAHDEAMKTGNTLDNMSDEDALKLCKTGNFSKFLSHYNNLKNRPDWDGYLTFKEALDWYKNGNGQPLYVNLSKIDLSDIFSLGEGYVGQKESFNLLLHSASLNDGLVFGHITLKRYPNHRVKAYSDEFDFGMHNPWNPFNIPRNIETFIGRAYAGEGKSYEINIYGSKKLVPLFPWIK